MMRVSVNGFRVFLYACLALLVVACSGPAPVVEDDKPLPELSVAISTDANVVHAGDVVTLTATVIGGNAAQVSWSVDSNAGELSVTSGETVEWTAPLVAGTYTVNASLTVDNRTVSDSLEIEVLSIPEELAISLSVVSAASGIGDVVEVEAVVTGDGSADVELDWTSDSADIDLIEIDGRTVSFIAPDAPSTITISAAVAGGVPAEELSIDIGLCGSGSIDDPDAPCAIGSLLQLDSMRSEAGYETGYFRLSDDIEATETSSWDEGAGFVPLPEFNGDFDGGGHTITGLTINRPSENYAGLFSQIDAGGQIRDLSLDRINVSGGIFVGALAGYSDGDINNISVSDSTITGNSATGGLVGQLYWKSASKITGSSVVESHVNGSGAHIGGLVGQGMSGSIIESFVHDVHVTGTDFVGGLIGGGSVMLNTSFVSESNVSGYSAVGGLAGQIGAGDITQSFVVNVAVKGTKAESNVGGLVGLYQGKDHLIKQSYVLNTTDSIVGEKSVGGLVGSQQDPSTGTPRTTESFSSTSVAGTADVGGLFGRLSNGTIEHSYWDETKFGQNNGFGVPIDDMSKQANFVGWDFTDVWQMLDGFPDLRDNSRENIPESR